MATWVTDVERKSAEVAGYTPEEAAREFDLPIEAVTEALRYVEDIRRLLEVQKPADQFGDSVTDSSAKSTVPIRRIPLASPEATLHAISMLRPLLRPSSIARQRPPVVTGPRPESGQIIDLESRRRERSRPS